MNAEPEGGDDGGAEETVYGGLDGDGDERVGVESGVVVGVGHGWGEVEVCLGWRVESLVASEVMKLLMKQSRERRAAFRSYKRG